MPGTTVGKVILDPKEFKLQRASHSNVMHGGHEGSDQSSGKC